MNTRFTSAVFLVLCALASVVSAGGNSPGTGHDEYVGTTRVAADDAQRRRADLRAALQAQQQAGNGNQAARQLTQQDRAELRQQLRQQHPTNLRP